MKYLLFTFISILCFIHPVQADLGSCVVYQAKFYLKDGSIFNGSFEHAGYEVWLDEEGKNDYCSDEGVFRLLKLIQKQMAHYTEIDPAGGERKSYAMVYKSLEAIPLKSIGRANRKVFNGYGFTGLEDMILLDSSEIEKVVFWKAAYSKRAWLTSEIYKSTQGFIDTLKNQQFWNHTYLDLGTDNQDTCLFSAQYPMWGYHFINYNDQINIKELQRLIRLKLKIARKPALFYDTFKQDHGIEDQTTISNNLRMLMEKAYQEKLDQIRQWFRKKGIVMIRVNDTC